MTDAPPTIDVAIDETNLGGDNGGIYVFQWLGSNEKALQHATPEDLKEQQAPLVEALLKIISTPDTYPLPGRPVRELVAQCLVHIYTHGETKTLYDTVQTLLKLLPDAKTTLKEIHRVAAMYCIGVLMKNFGSQIMSLVVETVTASLKLAKSSQPTIMRYHALITLENTLLTAKRAVTDSQIKDIVKFTRSSLSDKSFPVIRAASSVLMLLFPFPDSTKPLADVEQLVVVCAKQLEAADQPTRSALSKLVAHVLASTQVEHVVPVAEPSKQAKKGAGANQEEDDDDEPAGTHSVLQEVKKLMTPQDMLAQLSTQFNKPNTSRRTRIGIFDCYVALLTALGSAFAENNYALIVNHLMNELVSNPRNIGTRYEVLFVRKLVGIVLRDLIGVRMLGEQAQITAIQELSNSYLKRWPALLPGQTAPNALVLTVALREVAGLLQQLGNAPLPVQDALLDPMMTLLSHPVHTVRLSAAWTLRCFCYSTPLRLPKVLLNLVELLQHDLTALSTPAAPSDIHLRVLGRAYGLIGLLSVIPQRPLYVSYDISANVFYIAVQLLKRAGEHDVKVAKVELEVAWTMIASLMTLGPNFVRAHLPQLLVLWRNALPKPTTKDGLSGRSPTEWLFLLNVRENALRAVYSFLMHNSPVLVTADVARRITSLLTNALQFAGTFATQRVEDVVDQPPEADGKGLTLVGVDALFRTRIFQCFSALGVAKVNETTQSSLLQSAITLFASPEGYSGSSVQAAIAASSGAFTSIWQSTDCYAYGLTDIELVDDVSGNLVEGTGDWLNRDTIDAAIDDMCLRPILRSWEHDPLNLCHSSLTDKGVKPDTAPALTASVNAAISLFAELLPLQDLSSVTRTVTQLLEATASSKVDKNSGRKAAVLVNTTTALVLALRRVRQTSDTLGNPQVTSALADFLKGVLVDGDVLLRQAASEAIGRLASIAGTSFLTSQIKTLVNEVVSNRDPYGRAGCALAFGSVYSHVGGLAAGPLLKTTIHVLMSLINDPHPVVNFWALRALSRVIDAASLAYASHVPSTLGLLFKVYMLESHEPEGGNLNYVNMSGELPFYQALCQTIDAIITVVGPDIQESAKTRSLVLDLVHQFIRDDEPGVRVEAIRCIQHLLIFAPEHIDVPKLVAQFREYLASSRRPLKMTSINALYQLVQRDVMTISKLGGDQLVEELFAMLDDDSSIDGVRNVITSWLQQTVVYNPSAWIDLCQRIMSRTTASQQAVDAAAKRGEMADDEGQSLSVEPTDDGGAQNPSRSTARWRTQLFALRCLHEICVTVGRSGRREHLDIGFARSQGLPLHRLLVSRISDLIKIAFTASAAHVMEIRLEGLTVLRDVIEIFAESPDPDFEGALLLEQYQAPITAALTPAFSADATPEILASAIKACAVFVGSGVVKDVSRMGRILKLLTSALEQCQKSGLLQLGDAGELGPNASVMLRIATLSAWAELEIFTETQQYLVNVVAPYRRALASLWIGSLRDYASIKAGTELLDDSSTGAVDTSYSSLGKEVLLPYYRDSWSVIIQAVTSSMELGDPSIRIALDGGDPLTTEHVVTNGDTANDHPAAFFFVIFGLVFEALATSTPDIGVQSIRTSIVALKALKYLVQNQYAGNAFRDIAIFEELVNLFYRIALTEPVSVQVHLVETLASLATSISKAQSNGQAEDYSSPPQIHCLRICAYVLKRVINSPRENTLHDTSPTDKIKLINASFDAFITIAAACDPARNLEYRIVAVTLYNDLLKDELSDADYVGPTLQSLKKLLENPPTTVAGKSRYEKMVHAILSACLVNIDAMRGREGPACAKKIKSNLLAAVLILTVVPSPVRIGKALVEHCCFLISQKLADPDELSVIAAHCAKTLIMASTSGLPALQHVTRLLLPGMIDCVAQIAAMDDEASYDRRSQIIGEIWKAFSALFTSTAEENRARLLAVLLPTMTLLLEPASTPLPGLHTQTIGQVLIFAASSPLAFKEATMKLNVETREVLEASVRQALGGGKTAASDAHKPQISLRSF